MKIKVLLVGNRCSTISELMILPQIADIRILAHSNSRLSQYCDKHNLTHKIFATRNELFSLLSEMSADVLISNGCPYILNEQVLERFPTKINLHPSPLPLGKGFHPINGAFFNNEKYIGATLHHMTSELDQGNIISQKRILLTNDIDVDLANHMVFGLESEVFRLGFQKLLKHKFQYSGKSHLGINSYYKRSEVDRILTPQTTVVQALATIAAYGTISLGAKYLEGNRCLVIFQGVQIKNHTLIDWFNNQGNIIEITQNKFVIKVSDGLIYAKNAILKNQNE